jgi:TetR/AcrR family transcriptional regulator
MGRPRATSIDVETPERLLAAAEAEFAASGFERATLQKIAERAGITRPALLYHFASKDDLYEAVVGRAFASLAGILRSAMGQGADFRTRLRSVVDAFLTFVEIHPALARLVVRELIDAPERSLVVGVAAPLLDEIVTFVEHGAKTRVPVRAVLMTIVADVFLKNATDAGVRKSLWPARDHAWDVTEALLLPKGA